MKKFFLFCMIMLVTLSAYASRNEFYSPNYDFTKVEKVYVTFDDDETDVDYNTSQILMLTVQKVAADKVYDKLQEQGKNLYFDKQDKDLCDLRIDVELNRYDSKKVILPGGTHTEIVKERVRAVDNRGHKVWITKEVPKTVQDPPTINNLNFVGVTFTGTDVKTGKQVLLFKDDRERTSYGADNTETKDMYQRILKNFWDKFGKLLLKGKM